MKPRLGQRIITALAVVIVVAVVLAVLDQARIVFFVNVPWWLLLVGVIALFVLVDYALNRIFRS